MTGDLTIVSPDGVRHTAAVFAADSPQAPVVLFLPGMGAPADYYRPLAERIASEGVATAALLDLRGQGRSSARARRGDQFGYREILEVDLPQAILVLRRALRGRRLYVAGHSLGGQLGLFLAARMRESIAGVILVAAGTAHYRVWPREDRLKANLITAGVTLAAQMLPWYPGHVLGFGGEQPRRMMRDWGRVARKGAYRPDGSDFDYEAAARDCVVPVLSVGVREDPIAPAAAREALLEKTPLAEVTRVEIDGVTHHGPFRRHFSWARDPAEAVAVIGGWLASRGG
jgi:predicted alpha/beta hydrolase